jgi:hypothetical protein
MNSPDSTTGFETCPECSQRTASDFFRTVGETRLCFLCAQRAAESDASLRAQIQDRRYHGLGWLWKSIACTAAITVALLILRYLIISYVARNL